MTEPRGWPRHPKAHAERREERLAMVEQQIKNPPDERRAVHAEQVLAAMEAVPRHRFVPEELRGLSYRDRALSIGYDQTISQPYIVALMTELLELEPHHKVLEIGTGCGYQAAVLSHLTPHVYSIELIPQLFVWASERLQEQGYSNIRLRCGDGFRGWPEAAPFDRIIVACATPDLPAPLWEQLAPGGLLVLPLGKQRGDQQLVLARKNSQGKMEQERIIPVRFVPLVREEESREKLH